jgi:hypothetical protein
LQFQGFEVSRFSGVIRFGLVIEDKMKSSYSDWGIYPGMLMKALLVKDAM